MPRRAACTAPPAFTNPFASRRRGATRALHRATRILLALAMGAPVAAALAPTTAVAADAIAWGAQVPWLPYETALARAKAEGKAIGVVVYADWCPKCRALAPLFQGGTVADASSKVLWVLQNGDEQPAWLQERFASYGNYVPRVFFLRPDGSVDAEIQSGHPRYPYFYLASKPEALVASIDRAAAAGGPAQAAPPQPAAPAAAPSVVPAAPAAAAAVAGAAPQASALAAGSADVAPAQPGFLAEHGPMLLIAALALAAAVWAVRTGNVKT